MLNQEQLEAQLSELPLYTYFFFSTQELEFSPRIRWICEHECTMFGRSWACPPAVGTVEECQAKCLGYRQGLCMSTIVEVADIADIQCCLDTRRDHEQITEQVAQLLRQQGVEPYILSTESCAMCDRCAYPHGPCRHPDQMHPCVESQGIILSQLAERYGIEFQYGGNVVTWFSLLLY